MAAAAQKRPAPPAWDAIKPVPKAEGGARGGGGGAAAAAVEAALAGATPGPQREVRKEPLGGGVDAFVLRGVLAPEECDALLGASEALGYSFWHAAAPAAAAGAAAGVQASGADASAHMSSKRSFRSADTVEVTSERVAALVHERCAHLWTPRVRIEDGQARAERDILGDWYPCGVNEVLLFARYLPGGHFSPHTDGYNVVNFNRRSLYSLLVYLNDCEDGGETRIAARRAEGKEHEQGDALLAADGEGRFRWPEDQWLAAARCRKGDVLAFFQDLPHEGAPVGEGCAKYIIRTDVMYERRPALCDTPQEREAFDLFRRAELLEHEGDSEQAMRLFRRAFKLAPAMAEIYGCR